MPTYNALTKNCAAKHEVGLQVVDKTATTIDAHGDPCEFRYQLRETPFVVTVWTAVRNGFDWCWYPTTDERSHGRKRIYRAAVARFRQLQRAAGENPAQSVVVGFTYCKWVDNGAVAMLNKVDDVPGMFVAPVDQVV